MNKSDLVWKLAVDRGVSRNSANEEFDSVSHVIAEALRCGEEVRLPGLGVFSVSLKPARKGINPATGESIDISARAAISFKPARALRDEATEYLLRRGK